MPETRRCVLVTNNEVDAKTAAAYGRAALYRGDTDFEARGIFERATRPRCEAAITGLRPDGASVEGEYLDGRPYAQGFEENVEFYSLDYLDVDEVSLGRQLKAIFPLLVDDQLGARVPARSPKRRAIGCCRTGLRSGCSSIRTRSRSLRRPSQSVLT